MVDFGEGNVDIPNETRGRYTREQLFSNNKGKARRSRKQRRNLDGGRGAHPQGSQGAAVIPTSAASTNADPISYIAGGITTIKPTPSNWAYLLPQPGSGTEGDRVTICNISYDDEETAVLFAYADDISEDGESSVVGWLGTPF